MGGSDLMSTHTHRIKTATGGGDSTRYTPGALVCAALIAATESARATGCALRALTICALKTLHGFSWIAASASSSRSHSMLEFHAAAAPLSPVGLCTCPQSALSLHSHPWSCASDAVSADARVAIRRLALKDAPELDEAARARPSHLLGHGRVGEDHAHCRTDAGLDVRGQQAEDAQLHLLGQLLHGLRLLLLIEPVELALLDAIGIVGDPQHAHHGAGEQHHLAVIHPASKPIVALESERVVRHQLVLDADGAKHLWPKMALAELVVLGLGDLHECLLLACDPRLQASGNVHREGRHALLLHLGQLRPLALEILQRLETPGALLAGFLAFSFLLLHLLGRHHCQLADEVLEPALAEHLSKYLDRAERGCVLEGRVAHAVILGSLVRVREDLVRGADRLEPLLVATAVGVFLHRLTVVSLSNLIGGRFGRHSELIVKLAVRDAARALVLCGGRAPARTAGFAA
mmetsp:Transcript_8622/g.25481  ORF Transcript_8622/g.25481 Transcript_8622/m.25481 type:complete len:463 (-) Transcript_8622:199-1587(-)